MWLLICNQSWLKHSWPPDSRVVKASWRYLPWQSERRELASRNNYWSENVCKGIPKVAMKAGRVRANWIQRRHVRKAERKDVHGTKGLYVSAVGGKCSRKNKVDEDSEMEKLLLTHIWYHSSPHKPLPQVLLLQGPVSSGITMSVFLSLVLLVTSALNSENFKFNYFYWHLT